MTKEQLGELAEALSILSAKSSIVKEKEELKQLMESNISSEEVRIELTSFCFCRSPSVLGIQIASFRARHAASVPQQANSKHDQEDR